MAQVEVLKAQIRESRGKRNARRMRDAGEVPGVLYGHGQESVSLTLPADKLAAAIRHGHRLLQLEGGLNEQCLIRELQWNVWGTQVLHVDLTRVFADERVTLEVPIELHGESPGIKVGGVLTHVLVAVQVECPAVSVPEKLEININHLEVGQELKVSDLKVPQDVKVLAEPDEIVVHCHVPVERPEEGLGGPAEPELIQREAEGEGQGGE